MEPSSRSRNWCFTLNNWNESDYENVLKCLRGAKYGIVGKETGESGTPHLQGFVSFRSGKTMLAAKRAINNRCHVEPARGSAQQNKDYCCKDGNFEEFGTMPQDPRKQGERERQRWDAARAAARAGDIEEVDSDIYVRYYSTLKRIAADHKPVPDRLEKMEHVWYHAPSGYGKSWKAREDFPDFYDKEFNKWWDGYQGESAVLLDDLDTSHNFMGYYLKRWSDIYPFPAQVKTSHLGSIRPKVIVVTSQYEPEEIWPLDPKIVEAIRRRFKFISVKKWSELS